VCGDCGGDTLYSAEGMGSCSACTSGSYTHGNTALNRPSCSSCPGGYKCDGSSVQSKCVPGKFSVGSSGVCSDCGSDSTFSGTAASTCSVCAVGSHTSGGTTTTHTSCSPCPAGMACDGSSSITACHAGKYSSAGQDECDDCADDSKYSSTGATACLTCPAGSFTDCVSAPGAICSSRTLLAFGLFIVLY
jgi:hypothetical protein